jgi:Mg-chelatase subunit ChlD
MQLMRRLALVALAAALGLALPGRADEKKPAKPAKPKVEVVFCLDTTGSMSGLIDAAKKKVWSISNQIASGKPTPELKIGLVAYRDRGDAYVTQVHDLSDDLDAVYARLKTFQAQGGGDGPESVNQALADAVHKVKWSPDAKTLKIIFLVGDAPPHMDYADDVKYPDTCKKACEKGIIVNTVQCGTETETTRIWRDVAVKAEGTYVQIDQDGGATPVVATPFDKRLGEINAELSRSTLVYGTAYMREEGEDKRKAAEGLTRTAPGAAADRIAYQAKDGRVAAYDLLEQVRVGKVKLENLKGEELPAELKGKSLEEQKAFLLKLEDRRKELNKEVLDLDKKRNEFIRKEQEKEKAKGGFDARVLEMLRNQAKKHKIDY